MRKKILVSTLFRCGLAGGLLLAGFAVHRSKPDHCGAVASDVTAVKVSARREGDITRFFVENSERSEITMTFDFHTENLKGDVEFPYTATFGPGESEAFALSPDRADAQWEYSYTNYYKLGSS